MWCLISFAVVEMCESGGPNPPSHYLFDVLQLYKIVFLQVFALMGSVERSRHEQHFCSPLPYFYFRDFKFSIFICLYELHPLIWFFFKKSFRKKKSIRKTTQNALAHSIFIVLSIVLKLGTPLLHTQAQNTLLQKFQFRSES